MGPPTSQAQEKNKDLFKLFIQTCESPEWEYYQWWPAERFQTSSEWGAYCTEVLVVKVEAHRRYHTHPCWGSRSRWDPIPSESLYWSWRYFQATLSGPHALQTTQSIMPRWVLLSCASEKGAQAKWSWGRKASTCKTHQPPLFPMPFLKSIYTHYPSMKK